MNVNELAAAASNAAERYATARDRGHAVLTSLSAARKSLAEAEQARAASQAALQRLADAELAGTPAPEKAVSAAILAMENASRAVVWAEAVVSAGQRALSVEQSNLQQAEADQAEASETSRRASLRQRAEQLAYQA